MMKTETAPRDPRRRSVPALTALLLATLLAASQLVLLAPLPAAAAENCAAAVNPVACENAKPGADPDEWDIEKAGDPSIQGFSTDISVNAGESLDFKVDTDASAYTIDIYRTGWYQGLGARKIASVAPSAKLPQHQPECLRDVSTELVDCGTWSRSATWDVPAGVVSGVYVALLKRLDTGGTSHITFVVRNDASTSDVVFQTSDPTWQAYNTYGGSNFYQGAANGRAYKLSYNRPVTTRGDNDGRDFYFGAEYPLVRFLEKNGYDVTYQAGVDTDRHGEALKNHSVFLSVGHDEYWSGAQRANVEAARDAGVNLQFLSGNEVYWRTRYEPSTTDGTAYRTMVSYKETWANTKIDPEPEWTGTWRDPRLAPQSRGGGVPENALTGTAYVANFSDLAITVSADEGKYRLWRHTELASQSPGSRTQLAAHTIGYESNEDLDNGFRPPGLARLSTTTGPTPQYLRDYGNTVTEGTTTHHLTQYRAPSGALVFSAGSIQWTWGLDREHDGWGDPADRRMQQAQVNLLADMGAQPDTLDSQLTRTAASTDTSPPTAVITSPAPGTPAANGTAVTVTGTASDAGGGRVAGVEISTDDGETWSAAQGTTNWSYTYLQQGMDTQTIRARAIDDTGNFAAAGVSVPVAATGPFTVFGSTEPETRDSGDGSPVEVGMRFSPSVSGYVSAVRFYKSEANTGTHTGTLWDASGTALATVAFTGESASGWQQAAFPTPVAVTAGAGYVISYSAPAGHYAMAPDHWSARGKTAAPLLVAGGFGASPAGVYNSTPGRFPADSYRNTAYFVDVVFDTSSNAPLSASSQTPADGAAGAPADTRISAVLSKEVVRESVGIVLRDAAGTPVAGTTRYSAASRTAEFVPESALGEGVRYTAELSAVDADGNPLLSGGTWSFTIAKTVAEGECPCSLFREEAIPALPQLSDGIPLSLGVAFRPETSGTVTGVRFYKGPGNTGVHTGRLFGPGGAELGAVTFSGESASGWQTAHFAVPVPVQSGQEYVAAYSSPNGAYSANLGQFAGSYTFGPLTVPADGGRYVYGGTYPERKSTSGYLVDVVFERGGPVLGVSSRAPAAGATDVPGDTTVSGVFSSAIVAGSAAFSVRGPDGGHVAGQTTYDAGTRTATFRPAAPLAGSTTYTVDLTAASAEGLASDSSGAWSFTTAQATPEAECCSLFPPDTVPLIAQVADGRPVVLGTAFRSAADGAVRGIRFYKGPGNAGTHTGRLFAADGTVLASATFTAETGSGWQSVTFSSPVHIRAGGQYVAAYTSPTGTYSVTPGQFASAYEYGPLSVEASGGRFTYSGGYPGSSSAASYLVDVMFTPGDAPPEPELPDNGCPCSLYTQADVPLIDRVLDGTPVTLGTAFSVSAPGEVSAVRFYRGEGNTGPRTGYLFDAGGAELGRVSFPDGPAGWQSAALPSPVQLVPGAQYTVAYTAPAGVYSATPGGFSTGRDRSPLLVPANGGRYSYTGVFPDTPSGATYLVDVVFSPRPGPPG